MSEIALAKINSFAHTAQQADVSKDESIFVLTGSQLKEIIAQATKPLQDRLDALEESISLERAYDRQRISKLEQKEPQPLQKDRGDILRALLAANGGKMLLKESRKKMHLSRSAFSQLLATMDDYIETKPYHINKSAKILMLKRV
jgi:uncharacterized membrane protein